MLTRAEIDRKFAAQAAAVKAANLLPARLQAEADSEKTPAQIMRDIQEQQNACVITQAMPGPQAWGDYELPLPGTSQARQDRAVKGDAVTPQHSAAEGAMEADDGEGLSAASASASSMRSTRSTRISTRLPRLHTPTFPRLTTRR